MFIQVAIVHARMIEIAGKGMAGQGMAGQHFLSDCRNEFSMRSWPMSFDVWC